MLLLPDGEGGISLKRSEEGVKNGRPASWTTIS